MFWKSVHHLDNRARALADRHYSRQNPGAVEFCPPGLKIVLLGMNDDALWVSHRPARKALWAQKRRDGFSYCSNTYFRNESGGVASAMILEALAITRYIWPEYEPEDGFHTFIDPKKVKPTMRRGQPVYGWVFEKAGFQLWSGETKKRHLLRYVMPLKDYLKIEPIKPFYEHEQLRLIA